MLHACPGAHGARVHGLSPDPLRRHRRPLALAVLVFRQQHLVYSNAAAQQLAGRLRTKHRSELIVLLRDHLRSLEDKLDHGTTVSLLTGAHGEPFYIHVTPVAGGAHVAVTVRELGTTMSAFTQRYRLSPREAQVVELVLLGYRNRDIAGTLGTTPATVKKHLTHVFDKVGVDTRTQLVSRIA
jgi:DNA-binding CsgD family transcriptional regulator